MRFILASAFLAVRTAQKEIRLYAEVLLDITRKEAPRCCASFERHVLGGVNFPAEEFAELKRRIAGGPTAEGLSGRALERFEEKLRMGRRKSITR